MKLIRLPRLFSLFLITFIFFPFYFLIAQDAFFGITVGQGTELTRDSLQVLEGQRTLTASSDGNIPNMNILQTDPESVILLSDKTYIASFRYRVLKTPDNGFEALFYSPSGEEKGYQVPSQIFTGVEGDIGVVKLYSTLGPYNDYRFAINILGKGAVAIDSLIIQDEAGQASILSADFEEPFLYPLTQGQFQFNLDPPATFTFKASDLICTLRSLHARDLDSDGRLEIPLTITTYPRQTLQPIVILGNNGKLSNLTQRFFPWSVPRLMHSPYIFFPDLNNDGKEDLVFSEAGLDVEPWTGSRIVVALRNTDGTFRDISDLIPKSIQETRSYALGVGDMDKNGIPDLLMPDQLHGTNYCILSWQDDRFRMKLNWISDELWRWPAKLYASNYLAVDDMDGDGYVDVVAGGSWERPNIRIAYGSKSGFKIQDLKILPEGIFGHTEWEEWEKSLTAEGADSSGALILDLDNDGRKDLFLVEEQVLSFKPGFDKDSSDPVLGYAKVSGGAVYANSTFRVLMNKGNRIWTEIDPKSFQNILGWRLYISLVPMDVNADGFPDVVGGYWTKKTPSQRGGLFGSTFFINDGAGNFQVVEAPEVLPTMELGDDPIQNQLGIFLPTFIGTTGMEGLFIASKTSGKIIVRRGVTTSRFGTGPNFMDCASLGFPGYNERFYLQNYPEASSAVLARQFKNGLEHYQNVGIARGYQAFAPNATIRGTKGKDVLNLGIRSGDARVKTIKGGWQLIDTGGRYGTLTLIDIDVIAFTDGMRELR